MVTIPPVRFRIIILFLLIAVFTIHGCTLLKLKEDLKQGESFSLLCGYALVKSGEKGPVYVVAYELIQGLPKVAGHVRLSQSGSYELAVPAGRYYLAAFHDRNGNGKLDTFEEHGQYGTPDLIHAPNHQMVTFLSITLTTRDKKAARHLTAISIPEQEIIRRAVAGDLMDLDDPAFGENGRQNNYWEPVSFFKKTGANIWFLEPYDPQKTPILFIHGAAGAPADFKYIAQSIDRSVYQPWFFYYPGGLPLDFNAYMMAKKLKELHGTYEFNRLVLAAHSMGGLVTRAFLLNYGKYIKIPTLFISISTPWGGVDTAKTGVEQSPVVLPSWKDVAVDSTFMTHLHASRLPDTVRFYLLFSYKGNRNPFRSNNDGTISMASILDPDIQDEAVNIYGLNQGHVSILNAPETVTKISEIITREMPDSGHLNQVKDMGDLSVVLNLDLEETRESLPFSAILLEPLGNSSQVTKYLNHTLKAQIVRSIPPGRYRASLMIPSYQVAPVRVPVTIKPGETVPLTFTAKAEGFLNNMIIPETGSYDIPEITSIQLTGRGISRIITPAPSDVNPYNAYISQNDYLHEGAFYFWGLDAGEYQLTITARGYKTWTKTYRIIPGRFGNYSYIQMTPETP